MSWNIVLNKFLEMKYKAAKTGADLWDYDKTSVTCMEYWASLLQEQEYDTILKYLMLNEHGDFLLVKYGDYSDFFTDNGEITFDSFWDVYDGFFRECRSVVLDIKNDCLVLTPFRKFRNLNESEETSYENVSKRIREASCVEVSDKLDGSMQTARYYQGAVVMAGSQALDREESWRLADGYRMLTENDHYEKMLREHPDWTFIFEYISERDAHVVQYEEEGLFLIGIRSTADGRESSYREVLECAARYDIPTTKVFDKTLEEIMGELDSKKSNEAEGFVMNIDGFKVKIKYNDYVYMHKMLSAISSVNMIIQNIAEGHFDDMLAKVPKAYRERVLSVAQIVFSYMKETNEAVERAYDQAPKEDKKEFMIWTEENVEKRLRGFVRNKYLGKPYHVLKIGNRYLKLKDMGAEVQEVFGDETVSEE